ncbi:MAG: type V CRISPR-associated endonuclease Cas1 [Lentimicrobiaceae bacterium]|jgi:CRISPR-associated endonuclease Cas1|nr:type V CRISPR-associated endonuclease Cas1 [Lentimicrobiaceae bacterium]
MFTNKDIKYRSVFVINCIEKRNLRVSAGELLLEDVEANKTLTKLPFQKILALFVIGHITITTALIDKCTKYGIPLVVMKPNFRPVFFFSITAEANYLLRKKQYEYEKKDLTIPKVLVENKIQNQIALLEKTRLKTEPITNAIAKCEQILKTLPNTSEYDAVMGLEGKAAKLFFNAYFEPFGWKARLPRTKADPINSTLDIGYTILFNYIEAFTRLFGFDPYRGVYHQLWFKRKSLICDLIEPFRCIIDRQVRKALNLGQCKISDFNLIKGEYILKRDLNDDYSKMFYETLIAYKTDVFKYVQSYYRCFMQNKDSSQYPRFLI